MAMPPDIVWIVTTQWRAQAAGFAGDPNAKTPHLDALAAASVNYTQAVTPHPFGPFARAALLTGVASPANGVRDYYDPLPMNARTIAHEMAARGYATAFFGKWHLAARDRTAPLVGDVHARMHVPPEARGGFETWDGFEGGFLLNDPWLHGGPAEAPRQMPGYQSDVLCRIAAEYLGDARETRPRFCVVSLEPPHPPYHAPAGDAARPDPATLVLPANVPRGGVTEAQARAELAGYYAHIAATDTAIGRWLLPRARDAIVVFTSVHGDMHGSHGLFRKGWPHEESIRVPLLVRAARSRDGTPSGARSEELVSLLDLPRWTQRWAEKSGDGAAEIGAGPAEQVISMPSVVALPHQCDRRWRGARTRERKLVLNADDTPWLFFDLRSDPLEMHNLVGDPARAAEVAQWRQRVAKTAT